MVFDKIAVVTDTPVVTRVVVVVVVVVVVEGIYLPHIAVLSLIFACTFCFRLVLFVPESKQLYQMQSKSCKLSLN